MTSGQRPMATATIFLFEKLTLSPTTSSRRTSALAGAAALAVTITVRAVPPGSLEMLEGFPGIDYEDNSVTYTAPAFTPAALHQMIAIVRVGTFGGTFRTLRETLESTPEGRVLLGESSERYWNRWLDYESGRWKPEESNGN